MIHRAPFGSLERFIAVVIEHTAGRFPLWLTRNRPSCSPSATSTWTRPMQPLQLLKDSDIRATVDERNEKIGRKIRDAELMKIPFMLVIGEKEAETAPFRCVNMARATWAP
jgi:threonyl-tRNA synthetase